MKTCSKCGFVGDETLFVKHNNWCKECKKEYMKNYQKNNPDKIKEINNRFYKNHPGRCQKWQRENADKVQRISKRWRENHPEKVQERNEYVKAWFKTPKGKEASCKQQAKRRKLGHEPINKWFKGSEAHHLRYSKNPEEQDNDVTIYVPRKLHRSIYHNGNTGRGMREINIACLEWYLVETPPEKHNPKAKQLYWNYCTLPEPEWSRDK